MTNNDLFFDTDCLSSFLWIGSTNILQALYSKRIILPEPVYLELSNPSIPHIKQRTDQFIISSQAQVKTIEAGTEEYKLYTELVQGQKGCQRIGRGEAGGIALAKVYNGILASNNYKDIAVYIKKYHLKHIDTGRILTEALRQGLITEMDGNNIWKQMLAKKRILPADTFSAYLHQSNTTLQAAGDQACSAAEQSGI